MFHLSSCLGFLFPQRYGKTVTVRPPGNTAVFSEKISGVLPGKTSSVFPGEVPCPFVSFSVYISLIIMTRIYGFSTWQKPPGILPVLSKKEPVLRLGKSRRNSSIEFRGSEDGIQRIFFEDVLRDFFPNFYPRRSQNNSQWFPEKISGNFSGKVSANFLRNITGHRRGFPHDIPPFFPL